MLFYKNNIFCHEFQIQENQFKEDSQELTSSRLQEQFYTITVQGKKTEGDNTAVTHAQKGPFGSMELVSHHPPNCQFVLCKIPKGGRWKEGREKDTVPEGAGGQGDWLVKGRAPASSVSSGHQGQGVIFTLDERHSIRGACQKKNCTRKKSRRSSSCFRRHRGIEGKTWLEFPPPPQAQGSWLAAAHRCQVFLTQGLQISEHNGGHPTAKLNCLELLDWFSSLKGERLD